MKKKIPIIKIESPEPKKEKSSFGMTEKIILSALIIMGVALIISLISAGEKQKGCSDDVKAFCEANYMTYENQTMNKYVCMQSLIQNYQQRFYFTCHYGKKNLTTLRLELTELSKGDKNE